MNDYLQHVLVSELTCSGPFAFSTGMFNRHTWFNSSDCIAGNSAKWHEKYSHHHALVFGYIACHVTLKITESGGAKRGWAEMKMIKTGKLSHFRSDKLLKQCTLYTGSNIRRARIARLELERSDCLSQDACWGDEDEQFKLGLLKWGVDVEGLKKPVGPQRLFKCWIKD